jgi:small-conductance mechanosensitive channel
MTTADYTGEQSDGAIKAYDIILRIWGCITLFMVGNLLKVLLGKILALKFNKESHLNKMYTTLKKEQWLHCLLVPRQSYVEAGMIESGESGGLLTVGGSGGFTGFTSASRGRSTSRIFSKFRLSRSASDGDAIVEGGGGGGGSSKTLDQLDSGVSSRGGSGFDNDQMMLQTRSSSGFGEKFMFWRKSNAPLSIIKEESVSTVEMMTSTGGTAGGGTGMGKSGSERKDVSITIDTISPTTSTTTAAAQAPGSPLLPPVRVDGGAGGDASPLQRTSAGPASPLPPRAAIDAAYAAQKKRRADTAPAPTTANTTTGKAGKAHAATATSPPKQPFRRYPSIRSHTTTADSLASGQKTATTLQQHNKEVAAGNIPDFGTGPLRRDEVMTRLARLERYIRKTNLEVTYRDALNKMEKSEVTNEDEAKRIGLYLFWNVKSDFEKSSISKEDLEEFIPQDDVDDAYDMLDDDGDGIVTSTDCVSAVQTIYQERLNLAASLKDTRSIAGSLEVMIGIIIHLVFVMIYFYILFAVTFNQIWAFVSTVVLGLSFIFGQYIRQLFENTMFLFNSHPFDVGDMLFVDNDFLTVDEIQINFTICINSSKQRLWVPNQRLVNNPFINLTTSGNRTENIIILVDMDTPPHALDDIIAAMEALKEEMPMEYAAVGGQFRDAAVPMKMTMKLFYDFTHNGTNLARCSRARSRMYICVAAALQKAGVVYTWPAMRTLNYSPPPVGSNNAAAGVAAAAADPNTSSIVGVL